MHPKAVEYARWIGTPIAGYLSWLLVVLILNSINSELDLYVLLIVNILIPVGFVCFAVTAMAPKYKLLTGCITIYILLAFPIAGDMAGINTRDWNYSALWFRDLSVVIVLPVLLAGMVGYALQMIVVKCIYRPRKVLS